LDDYHFIVVRKNHYIIFKILQKKNDFISKEKDISYELESTEISINYKALQHYIPTGILGNNLAVVGGFFNGYVQFLFTEEGKCNQSFKFEGLNTITSI
jgi:hypothetical protein